MPYTTLRLDLTGPVATLTLARPRRLNAMSVAMLEELIAAAEELDRTAGIRAVVVAGEGRAFCAGYDLEESPAAQLGPESDLSAGERWALADLGRRMADAVEGVRAVTVAALHGHVVGGGVVLAAACDLRVAADDTVFSIPEVDLGIPLGWGGVPRLVREIGPARTRELVMTCRPFGAPEASAMGFVNRLVDAADLADAARALADSIAGKPRFAAEATKRQVAAATAAATAHGDADLLLEALASPESQRAAAAYRERLFGSGEGAEQ